MTCPLGWQDTLVLRAVARLALRHDLGTMTNWAPWTGASHDSGAEAIAVMAWSRLDVKPPNHHGCGLCWVSCVRYGQLHVAQDGLADFRRRLDAEAELRGIQPEHVDESPWLEYSEVRELSFRGLGV